MFPERFAPVLAELQPLADRFTGAGHRLFIVGGMVRDLLVDRFSGGDFDLTTGARPDEMAARTAGQNWR
jgi:poly(A) polymerase